MEKAEIRQFVTETSPGDFKVTIEIINDYDMAVYIKELEYKQCNTVYAAYKSLTRTVGILPRYGIKVFDFSSNIQAIVKELRGNYNANTKLISMLRDRIKDTRVSVDDISLIS